MLPGEGGMSADGKITENSRQTLGENLAKPQVLFMKNNTTENYYLHHLLSVSLDFHSKHAFKTIFNYSNRDLGYQQYLKIENVYL